MSEWVSDKGRQWSDFGPINIKDWCFWSFSCCLLSGSYLIFGRTFALSSCTGIVFEAAFVVEPPDNNMFIYICLKIQNYTISSILPPDQEKNGFFPQSNKFWGGGWSVLETWVIASSAMFRSDIILTFLQTFHRCRCVCLSSQGLKDLSKSQIRSAMQWTNISKST